jgi:hypothetical protein
MLSELLLSVTPEPGGFSVTLTPQMLVVVPVIGGLVQMVKQVPFIRKQAAWLPLVTVLLGVAVAFGLRFDDPVMAGLLMGLASGGGYDLLRLPGKLAKGNATNTDKPPGV